MNVAPIYERISAAYEVLSALQARITEISSGDFPSDNPRLLLNLLGKLVNSLEVCLFWQYAERASNLALQDTSSKTDRELRRLEMRVAAIVEAAARLTPVIKFVDGARAQINPWGLVSQVERLSRHIARDGSVIIRPRWEYNYTYYPVDVLIKGIIAKVEDFDQGLYTALSSFMEQHPRFFVLSFPPTQVNNVLQIATWAHELGHFVDNLEGERRTEKAGVYLSDELLKNIRIQLTSEEREQVAALLLRINPSKALDEPPSLDQICEHITLPTAQAVRGWSREMFADLFSIHVFGPAALFGFCDLALVLLPDLDAITDRTHPSLRRRLRLMMDELERWSAAEDWTKQKPAQAWMDFLPPKEREAVQAELDSISEQLDMPKQEHWLIEPSPEDVISQRVTERVAVEVASLIRAAIEDIVHAPSDTDCYLKPADFRDIGENIKFLHSSVPPLSQRSTGENELLSQHHVQLALCMNAGWFYWFSQRRYPDMTSDKTYKMLNDKRDQINRLLLKSIELSEAQQWFTDHRSILAKSDSKQMPIQISPFQGKVDAPLAGGALGKKEITRRLSEGSLVIMPLLDPDEQLDEAAIDLRLGNEFITTSHTRLQAIDPGDQQIGAQIAKYQTRIYIPFGSPFVLHPMQFVLGGTLEYIALPDDLTGLVVGRSSWGRLGLIIATAIKIDPDFKGALTLEIVNLGSIPILLYPCSRIAQLVLYNVSGREAEVVSK